MACAAQTPPKRLWREIGAPPVLDLAVGGGDTGTALVDAVDYVTATSACKFVHSTTNITMTKVVFTCRYLARSSCSQVRRD
jgi:hypothetical protein